MGLEPLRAEAKRTLGRGPQRATGAPSEGVAVLGFELRLFLGHGIAWRSDTPSDEYNADPPTVFLRRCRELSRNPTSIVEGSGKERGSPS